MEATVTFAPSEYGSYTVNGQAITEDYTITQSSLNAYRLAATPAAGYIFRGWYNVDTGTCVATDAAVSLKFEDSCTITARFVPEDTSLFETGGQVFDNLSDATAYAQKNGQTKVTLHSKKATLTEENTIPAGITLLIPCDAAKTCYTKTPATPSSGNVTNEQNIYSTLVLEDGATLNVDGAAYNGNTPTRSMDEQYRYSFKGWTPEIVVVSKDAVYTAEYNKTERVFHTVAFDANDGEGTMDGQRLEVGYETGLTANAFSRTGYTFTGWNTAADGSGTAYDDQAVLTGLTEDITLYAQWQINHYTVTWTDDNGNTLYSAENVEYGSPIPEYAGKTPAKEENEQYTYIFAGWKPEDVTTVTGDITFTPVFTGNLKQYTITWKNWDGTVLLSEQVDYGTVPAYSGTPTRPGDAEHTYSFAGWEPVISAVTGNAEYTAVYTETINTYTVTWKNWDDSILEIDEEVEYGATPEYNGDTPHRPADAQYTYSFKGWAPQVDTVTGNMTYTAVYQQTVNQYTVTWNDWDGTQLKSEKIAYGETPAYSGENPSRAEDVRATYTFNGWSPAISPVTGNVTYTAQYTENIKSYDIVWKNEDGTVLDTKQVPYGETPAYSGETPTKEGDAQYTYTFTGWNPEVTSVTGSAVYTAVFKRTVNQYTITWKNEDGSVLKSEQVNYGTIPSYTGEAPTKEGDAQYRYSFKGWTPETAAVTADVTYIAQYEKIVNTYKVTWVVNGVPVETNVEYGAKPSFNGEEPTKEPGEDEHCTYRFLGWVIGTDENGEDIFLDDNTTVTGEMTCTAKFEKVMDTYSDAGYIVKGIYEVVPQGGTEKERCVFDGNGVFQSSLNGVYDAGEDTYWVNSGIVEAFPGLKRIVNEDGHIHYYYFGEDGKAVKDGNHMITSY